MERDVIGQREVIMIATTTRATATTTTTVSTVKTTTRTTTVKHQMLFPKPLRRLPCLRRRKHSVIS
jgi:hypothetical protein